MWVCFIPTHLKKTSLFVSWRAFGQLETPHLSLITNDDDELVSGLTTVCSSLLLQYIWAVFTHRLRPKETLSHEIISRTSGTVKPDQIMMCLLFFLLFFLLLLFSLSPSITLSSSTWIYFGNVFIQNKLSWRSTFIRSNHCGDWILTVVIMTTFSLLFHTWTCEKW